MGRQKKTPRRKRKKKSRIYRLSLYGQPRWDLVPERRDPPPKPPSLRIGDRVRHRIHFNMMSYLMSFVDVMEVERLNRVFFGRHPYFDGCELFELYSERSGTSQLAQATMDRINAPAGTMDHVPATRHDAAAVQGVTSAR